MEKNVKKKCPCCYGTFKSRHLGTLKLDIRVFKLKMKFSNFLFILQHNNLLIRNKTESCLLPWKPSRLPFPPL